MTLNFEASKAVAPPGEDEMKDEEEESHSLEAQRSSSFWQLSSRAKFYDARQAGHSVRSERIVSSYASTNHGALESDGAFGRYLKARPRAVAKFEFQNLPESLDGFRGRTGGGCQNLWRMHRSCAACIRLGHVNSSAAVGIAYRRGNGKFRHVRVGTLWTQELVDEEEVTIQRVLGANSVADVLTKNVLSYLLDKHATALGFLFPGGRAESGLAL